MTHPISKNFVVGERNCRITIKSNGSVECDVMHRNAGFPCIREMYENNKSLILRIVSDQKEYAAVFDRPVWATAAVSRFNTTRTDMKTLTDNIFEKPLNSPRAKPLPAK